MCLRVLAVKIAYHPGHTWKSTLSTIRYSCVMNRSLNHLLNLSSNSIIPTTKMKTHFESTAFHVYVLCVCIRSGAAWKMVVKQSHRQVIAWFLFHKNSTVRPTSSTYIYTFTLCTVHHSIIKILTSFFPSYLPHLGHFASHPKSTINVCCKMWPLFLCLAFAVRGQMSSLIKYGFLIRYRRDIFLIELSVIPLFHCLFLKSEMDFILLIFLKSQKECGCAAQHVPAQIENSKLLY